MAHLIPETGELIGEGGGHLILEGDSLWNGLTNWRDAILTIRSGETESEELNLQANGSRRVKDITFVSPTLAERVTLRLGDKVSGTYAVLNDGYGNDVVLLSGKSQVQANMTAGSLKLVSDTAVAADRGFYIKGVESKWL